MAIGTQKARKEYTCSKCGRTIHKGEVYKNLQRRYHPIQIRCTNCGFKRSETTDSEYLAGIYDVIDDFDDMSFGMPSELESAKDEIISSLEEIKSGLEDRKGNIPENLENSPNAQLLDDRIEKVETAISNLESIDDFEDIVFNDDHDDFDEEFSKFLEKNDLDEETELKDLTPAQTTLWESVVEDKEQELNDTRTEELKQEMGEAVSELDE